MLMPWCRIAPRDYCYLIDIWNWSIALTVTGMQLAASYTKDVRIFGGTDELEKYE
jgi:hypothetical protein